MKSLPLNDGKAGAKMAAEQKPDLVLLDVMMDTDVSGFDAVEAIRKLPDGKELPIIMITSFDEHHQAAWVEKPDRDWVDVNNYLRKPIAPDTLLAEVAKYIG